jgi:hypothetical protein
MDYWMNGLNTPLIHYSSNPTIHSSSNPVLQYFIGPPLRSFLFGVEMRCLLLTTFY